jgi:hypothetical protein
MRICQPARLDTAKQAYIPVPWQREDFWGLQDRLIDATLSIGLVSTKNGWSEALRFEGTALEWQTNGIPPIKERAKRSALY